MKEKIAIQGGLGSFHHEAVSQLFQTKSVEIVDKNHFRDVVAAVKNNEVDFGLIALENSIAGSILANYNLIYQNDLKITQEIYCPIRHQFMVLPGVKIEKIKKVYSHSMALLQCEDFLSEFPYWQRIDYIDTAKSAQKIKDGNLRDSGAIASQMAAELYDMEILKSNIQTFNDNFTRFVLLGKNLKENKNYNKISLSFTLPHQSGSLSNVLLQFSIHALNLANIQSYPIHNEPFRYRFYVDVLVENQKSLDKTLSIIKLMTENLVVLGKYEQKKMY